MPAPPYRLQTLLEIRERKKEAAEQHLGTTMRALQAEEDKLREMEAELQRMVQRRVTLRREYMERAMRGEVSAQKAIDTNVYGRRLQELEVDQQEAIAGQKEVILARQGDVDRARAALVVATQELKSLEKHREQWREELRRERARKEDEALDELAQNIFLRGGG